MKKVYIEAMVPDNYEELAFSEEGLNMGEVQVLDFKTPEQLTGALVYEMLYKTIGDKEAMFNYTIEDKTNLVEYVTNTINENKMLVDPIQEVFNIVSQLVDEFEELQEEKQVINESKDKYTVGPDGEFYMEENDN